jgi:hypothetical protein
MMGRERRRGCSLMGPGGSSASANPVLTSWATTAAGGASCGRRTATLRRSFAGRRPAKFPKSEKPTGTPNQVFFPSLGAAFGGDRTPSATAKEAFGRGGRKDCAGSGAEKQPIGRH